MGPAGRISSSIEETCQRTDTRSVNALMVRKGDHNVQEPKAPSCVIADRDEVVAQVEAAREI